MNIVQLQDQLKNFSQDQLVREMQTPSGSAPQFLVLGEIMRRKRMKDDFTAQNAKGDQGTVAQEAIAAAGVPQGGIADMARALAPSTDMAQNTGVQAMYAGGPVKKMAKGDKVKTDPAVIAYANKLGMSVDEYLESLGEEGAARVIANVEQRAERSRMMGMEPVGDSITAVNPSYREPTASVFPPDTQPYNLPPVFERYAGREGLPSFGERVDAAQLPSFTEMTTPSFELSGREGLPNLQERVRRANSSPLNDVLLQDTIARSANTNTVRPEVISGAEPSISELLAALPGMDQSRQNREELAYSAQMGRAAPQTGLPTAMESQQGPRAVSRSGAPVMPTYDPLSSSGSYVDAILGAMGGRTVEDQAAIAAEQARRTTPEVPKLQPLPTTTAVPGAAAPQGLLAAQSAALLGAQPAAAPQGGAQTAAASQGGTSGGTSGGAGGVSSYEQALMDTLSKREKAAEQDKWLALAQVGLNLMSSRQPTLGGALGEAGLKGIEAARSARDQYDKEKLELTGAIAQSRAARAKAASGGGSGGGSNSGGFGLSAGTGRLLTQINSDIERLDGLIANSAVMPPTTPEAEMQLAAVQQELNNKLALRDTILYGSTATDGGADEVPNFADE